VLFYLITIIVSSLFTTILYMVKEMVAIHKFGRSLNIVTFLLFQLLLFLIYLSLMFISHPFIPVNSSFRIVKPSMISLILISVVLLFRVVIRSTVPVISRFISGVLSFSNCDSLIYSLYFMFDLCCLGMPYYESFYDSLNLVFH